MHVQHSISCTFKALNVRPLTRCVPFRSWCSSLGWSTSTIAKLKKTSRWPCDFHIRQPSLKFISDENMNTFHPYMRYFPIEAILESLNHSLSGLAIFWGQLDLRRHDMNTMLGSTFERLPSDFRVEFYADEYFKWTFSSILCWTDLDCFLDSPCDGTCLAAYLWIFSILSNL